MTFNSLFQMTIIILWKNIALAMTLEPIQRFRLQKQHVQITTNVAVFMTQDVMVINGGYTTAIRLSLPHQDLAHGPQVSCSFPSTPENKYIHTTYIKYIEAFIHCLI